MDEPVDPETGLPRDVFFCGDDGGAKRLAGGLIQDLGIRPIDCGDLSNALILDLLVPLIIDVDRLYKPGRLSSWKLLG